MPLRQLRSIRTKLLAVVLTTNLSALLITGAALLYVDLREYKQELNVELSTQADILGLASTAALEFNDPRVANENLALLKARPPILAAAIYTASGRRFASYTRNHADGERFPALPEQDGSALRGDQLQLFKRITNGHEILGTVYISAQLDVMHRAETYLAILAVVIAAGLSISIVISAWLQQSIARPILAIASLARHVMENRDFNVRAVRTGRDEIALLTDAFNDMLGEVGERTAQLEASRHALEREVHERRATQHSLAASERRNRSLVTAMSSVVWTCNALGQFVTEQPAWQAYTGQRADEYDLLGWRLALHPDDRPQVDQRWAHAATQVEHFGFSARLFHEATQAYREADWRAVPVFDESGKLQEWIGTVTDVNDQRMAEREVARLNAELEQRVLARTQELEEANKNLESFSYSISHDLRTPLRAISGFAEMLERRQGPVLNDDGKRLLGVVIDEANRMGMLIDDLLAFARLGRQAIKPTQIDTRQLVQEIFDQLEKPESTGPGQLLLGTLPVCEGDLPLLRQVWVNLLSNAIKFSAKATPPRIEIGAVSDPEKYTFFIRDNGVGFDPAHQAKLFGVFQRLHRSDDYPGNGVGLALVHRIVTRHGGTVWAEGQPGQGATFYFTLPRRANGEKEEAEADGLI